jgi:hypothetical protein
MQSIILSMASLHALQTVDADATVLLSTKGDAKDLAPSARLPPFGLMHDVKRARPANRYGEDGPHAIFTNIVWKH